MLILAFPARLPFVLYKDLYAFFSQFPLPGARTGVPDALLVVVGPGIWTRLCC